MKKIKEPRIPPERHGTIRQEIISVLEGNTLSAKEISGLVGISEKDVYAHLEHVERSLKKDLVITPARCKKCGFVFKKRERLTKPGRCPVCKGQSIEEPLFSVKA
jgi:predicted Zn-ribbon and HTH transcriptional regulator